MSCFRVCVCVGVFSFCLHVVFSSSGMKCYLWACTVLRCVCVFCAFLLFSPDMNTLTCLCTDWLLVAARHACWAPPPCTMCLLVLFFHHRPIRMQHLWVSSLIVIVCVCVCCLCHIHSLSLFLMYTHALLCTFIPHLPVPVWNKWELPLVVFLPLKCYLFVQMYYCVITFFHSKHEFGKAVCWKKKLIWRLEAGMDGCLFVSFFLSDKPFL